MSQAKALAAVPNTKLEMLETGTEPEFFVTDVVAGESLPGGNVRMYCCARKRDKLILLYTVVVPIENLAVMARQSAQIAAEAHNIALWDDFTTMN